MEDPLNANIDADALASRALNVIHLLQLMVCS